MSVFKEELETKRVIFNVRQDLADRLEKAKEEARALGKRLDLENVIDKSLEKFLKKAEKKLSEIREKMGSYPSHGSEELSEESADPDTDADDPI